MTQELFCDETFGGTNNCLFNIDLDLSSVKWNRPQELCGAPSLYAKNYISEPLQGKLGNCWLISVCHILSKNEKLLQSTFVDCQCPDLSSSSYNGKWSVCLWDSNKDSWVKVTIDDRLPAVNNQLIFGSNKDNSQFWLPLLEKACAKFYGGYSALCCGQVSEAFMLLTAGYSWRKFLSEQISQPEIEILQNQIQASVNHQTELNVVLSTPEHSDSESSDKCSAIENDLSVHLVPLHYYVVTGICSGDQIELWNPWRNANDSQTVLVPLRTLLELGVTLTFSAIKMQKIFGCDVKNQFVKSISGEWQATVNCGGKYTSNTFERNPQYIINFKQPHQGLVYVSLVQSNKREHEKRNALDQAIGIHVWKISAKTENRVTGLSLRTNPPDFKTKPSYQFKGDVSVFCVVPSEEVHLLVVPSTHDYGINRSYLLRICSSLPCIISLLRDKKHF